MDLVENEDKKIQVYFRSSLSLFGPDSSKAIGTLPQLRL